jgi:hypothetical protein
VIGASTHGAGDRELCERCDRVMMDEVSGARYCIAVVLLSACARGGSTIAVAVRLEPGEPSPSSLAVSVYRASGAVMRDRGLASTMLPGELLLRSLPAGADVFRIVITGNSPGGRTLGGARVTIIPYGQARADVALSAKTPDQDGDGVPDDLDDCPTFPDPDQGLTSCPGSPDGGGTDGATPARCPAGVEMCQSFEGPFDGLFPPWWNAQHLSVLSIDATRAVRGARSLRVHTLPTMAGPFSQGIIGENHVVPITGRFFARAFYYLAGPQQGLTQTLMSAYQTDPPNNGVNLAVDGSGHLLLEGLSGKSTTSSLTVARNQWVCVEWEVDVSSSATSLDGAMRVWLDEVLAASVQGTATQLSPPLGSFNIGASVYYTPVDLQEADQWIDELIVDNQPIGCAK